MTTDAIVEGVHFFATDPPETIARKALRVNLSDLAAKGATPAGFVMTLALRRPDEAWLSPFARSLGEDAVVFGCPILGGDTVSTPGPLMISITAFGRVPPGRMVPRGGAKAGDRVFVTGTIGDAALGLDILQNGKAAIALLDDRVSRDALVERYRIPTPRTALAASLRACAHAAMDVSDGLAGDLAKMCAASRVSARVELAHVPLSQAAVKAMAGGGTRIETLLAGGDDYEILCAVPENRVADFKAAVAQTGIAAADIGVITVGTAVPEFVDAEGRPIALPRLSYSHF